ncbi:Acyl-CoA dehydrogenase [Cryptosporangium aurantiacum]|uniref:Acyl-CoA dehydrogenase n=2 Tax=Cryptosporangium aurantiacum TaxID=134849 RepID=A0A1M7R2V1_9ACTN|nr:Acyl-CoA dehydrogenase [Cryptosporangium aurantiacum]
MVLDATVRFIQNEFPLSRVRERVDGREGVDSGYRKGAAGLGWFGLLADEAHGGGSASDNGLVDAAMIAAERGAVLQPGPYVGHSVVVHALSTAGGDPRLADLLQGNAWATWIPGGVELRGQALHGVVGAAAEIDDCAWLLVTARSPEGPTQLLVPTDAPGMTVHPLHGLDLTRRWFRVEFDGVIPAADPVIGGPGPETARAVARQEQIAAVLSAAEAVGAMHANFALALEYAKSRIAFGRPIGSFQAIKHLLADTSLWLEMSKAIVVAAAEAGEGPLAHAAKSFVGERSAELTQNCFQVFGGIGYTWEHDQHLYLRRLAAERVAFGSPSWHREQLLKLGNL